jgi:type 1 fimbriae regulatory protein FimB
MTRDGFAKLLKAAAEHADIDNVHPHALRHTCSHALAMKGRDTPADIQHTSHYTDGVSKRFKGIWISESETAGDYRP